MARARKSVTARSTGAWFWKVERSEDRLVEAFSIDLLLTQAALDRMLAGLSTRRYRAGLEPIGDLEAKGTSRSSISRRFVTGTKRKLAELVGWDLSELDLLALFLDGIETEEHTIVVALGSTPTATSTRSGSGRAVPRTGICQPL